MQGSAWSGGDAWKSPKLLECLTQWVYEGGIFLGVGEPSAVSGEDTCFRMAHVLGVDLDHGERICHGKWPGSEVLSARKQGLYLTEPDTEILLQEPQSPLVTRHAFGKGQGIYLSSFTVNPENTRLLTRLLSVGGDYDSMPFVTDKAEVECTYFPNSNQTIVMNNSDQILTARWKDLDGKEHSAEMKEYETRILTD